MALLLFASLAAVANAKDFLHPEVRASSVESALLAELSAQADDSRLLQIEGDMYHTYLSLPKNAHGRLDPASVRYALHRYFMQKHGWYVNGLGPSGKANDTSTTEIMKDRAPAFIQNLFEKRLHGQGLDQHDLAVFAATLTDLIHSEVVGSLQEVYEALNLPTFGPVSASDQSAATTAYLITYLSGGRQVVTAASHLLAEENTWREDYPAWDDTRTWASDLEQATEFLLKSTANPFVSQLRSFGDHVSSMQEFGHRLGTFQNLECQQLKDQLVEMEDVGTGRVPLSRFYRGGLEGDWTFTESVEYLRHIGALDETDPKRMSVVIPNYIQSESNCLAGSSFYSICCFDECEGLLGRVEQQVKKPSAPSSQIASIISGLQSDTVHAPRNLSSALLGRLEQIADHHGGIVPLHGRLFAQWMHHAFPRECSFPHVIGATNRISAAEWMDAMDLDSAEVREEEMTLLVNAENVDVMALESKAESLPWTMAEELVAGHLAMAEVPAISAPMRFLRWAFAAVILLSIVAPLMRGVSAPAGHSEAGKVARYLV